MSDVEADEVFAWIIVTTLVLSPFLIGYVAWILLAPIGFWQVLAAIICISIICIVEGSVAWFVAFIIIDNC